MIPLVAIIVMAIVTVILAGLKIVSVGDALIILALLIIGWGVVGAPTP